MEHGEEQVWRKRTELGTGSTSVSRGSLDVHQPGGDGSGQPPIRWGSQERDNSSTLQTYKGVLQAKPENLVK